MSMVRERLVPAAGDRTRGGKAGKVVENKDFAAFAKRILAAHAKRVAAGDVEALPDLVAFSRQVDEAIAHAVLGLREFGYTWEEIGSRLGVSKQAVAARWGKRRPGDSLADQDYLPTLHQAGDAR